MFARNMNQMVFFASIKKYTHLSSDLLFKMRIPIPTKNILRNCGFLSFVAILILIYIIGRSTDINGSLNLLLDIESDNVIPANPNNLSRLLHEKVYNFKKHPNLLKTIIAEQTKPNIDLLLNIRKLTLFAAREFSRLEANEQNCIGTWKCATLRWTNPLKIMILRTYTYSGYRDHDLMFPVEPGHLPFYVRIRQRDLTLSNVLRVNELKIVGNFYKLKGNSNNFATTPQVTSEDNPDDEAQLYSWKLNQSYFVSDYIPLNDIRSFIISPQGGRVMSNGTVGDDPYCGPILRMLIVVLSEPLNFKNRQNIRETYGSPGKLVGTKVKVVFLLGRFPNKKLQVLVKKEADMYGDIIQGSFTTAYHNLSLAHLSIYDWVAARCREHGMPKHILKASDEIFVNIELTLQIAKANPHAEMIGSSNCGNPPFRGIGSIASYYTPRYMYIPDMYPGYLSGSGAPYLIRSDVIPKLLKVALTTPIIHMDDIYVTGLLPRQLNIVPRLSYLFTVATCKMDLCDLQKMTSCVVGKNMDMKDVWKEYNKDPCPALANIIISLEDSINPSCFY